MEQLLNEKRKINASLSLNDTYKFQIFSGTSDMAKKALIEFRQEFEGIELDFFPNFDTERYLSQLHQKLSDSGKARLRDALNKALKRWVPFIFAQPGSKHRRIKR